jgi:hypothetical protein
VQHAVAEGRVRRDAPQARPREAELGQRPERGVGELAATLLEPVRPVDPPVDGTGHLGSLAGRRGLDTRRGIS